MKISKVINKLQEIQKEHGDLEAFVYDEDGNFFPATRASFNVEYNELYIGS